MMPQHLGAIMQHRLKLKALDFRGGIRYVAMGDSATYNFDRTDPFSIQAWVKFTSSSFMIVGGKFQMFSGGLPTDNFDRGYYLQVSSGKIGFFLTHRYRENPPGTVVEFDWLFVESTTGGTNDGAWHHLVATYDGSSTHAGMKLYVDAVAKAKNNSGGPLTGTTLTTGGMQWSGRQAVGGRGEFPYTGQSNDLAVYNKELSAAEVTTLFADHCPPRLESVGPVANLVGFWRPSLSDTFPTVTDLSSSAKNGTMTNMLATDIYSR